MNYRLALVATVLMTAMTGCQSYQRVPLQLDGYSRQWEKRPLDINTIQSYAASLSDATEAQAPFDSRDGISLFEAQAVALHFNPRLRLARAAAEVPLASAKEAGWWPDPQFEMEILRYVDRGKKSRFKLDGASFDGINSGGLETTPVGIRRVGGDYIDDPLIIGAGLSITIPISGRLAVEKDLRWSEYSAAWRRILVSEWELVTELRAAWLKWSSSAERLRITRDYIGQLETIAQITEQLVKAGEMKPTDGRLLKIELAHRRTKNLSFEREQEQDRLTVLSLMGLAPNSTVSLQPKLSIEMVGLPVENLRDELVKNHPQIKSAEADYEAAEQQLRLEIRRQYPDLNIGPSYSTEEGLARFGLGIGFQLPLWNRNRQAIAEAMAAREATRIRAEAVVENVLSTFAQVQLSLKYASQRRNALLETVAPLVEKQVEDSRTLLNLGEVDVLLLRDALTSSLNTKVELLDAALAKGRAANELQQMLQPRWFTPSQVDIEENK